MRVVLSNASPEPIYRQICDQIKALILTGEMEPGQGLPSIRALAKDLRISVITTTKAYAELEQEGYIESVPGKGSFVAEQSKDLMRERRMRVLEDKVLEAIAESKLLRLSLEDFVELVRLLYEEDR